MWPIYSSHSFIPMMQVFLELLKILSSRLGGKGKLFHLINEIREHRQNNSVLDNRVLLHYWDAYLAKGFQTVCQIFQ